MYLTHFGLNQIPFSITPDLSFFFTGNKRGEILDALIYAVLQGDGIVKVTGEVGCGKTMLCRMLESKLPDSVEVIYLVNPTLTREQVIYTIAGELELPVNDKRVDQVIRLLHTALISRHIAGKQVVLLIEEAQAMSLATLEEIRLFSNLETAHHKLLQIVLFGQPELDDHLNLPRMRQLKERITNSFKVPPLKPTSVPEYLMFRLHAAGYHGRDPFSTEAINLISRVSEGIVRRISILADKSLLAAYADNSYEIKPKHVRAAIEDSEFPKSLLRTMNRKIAGAAAGLLLVVALVCIWHFAPATAPAGLPVTPVALDGSLPESMQARSGAVAAQPVESGAPSTATPQVPADRSGASLLSADTQVAASSSAPLPLATDRAVTSPAAAIPLAHTTIPAPALPSISSLPASSSASAPLSTATSTIRAVAIQAPAPASNGAAMPAPESVHRAATAAMTLDQRLQLTNTWLNAQAPDHYSVQIATIKSGDRTEVLRILRKLDTEVGLQDVYVYTAKNNPSFGIVLGSYGSRREAASKLDQLAQVWGYRPQLRTFGGIKREVNVD